MRPPELWFKPNLRRQRGNVAPYVHEQNYAAESVCAVEAMKQHCHANFACLPQAL